MILDATKRYVKENKGVYHKFLFKGSRNQIDEFEGRITEIYSAIFIITLPTSLKKSFTYSDLLIGNLEIVS